MRDRDPERERGWVVEWVGTRGTERPREKESVVRLLNGWVREGQRDRESVIVCVQCKRHVGPRPAGCRRCLLTASGAEGDTVGGTDGGTVGGTVGGAGVVRWAPCPRRRWPA